MSKMILSELLQARSSFVLQFCFCTAIGILGGVGMQTPYAAFAMGFATFAFGHAIGMPYWDEQSEWQLLRLALPFSRRNIVLGRYACALVFSGVALVIGAVSTVGAFAVAGLLGIALEAEALFADVVVGFAFTGALLVSILLISCGTLYAIGFRFGLSRAGRWLLVGFMALFISLSVALGAAGEKLGAIGEGALMGAIASLPTGVLVGGILALCVLYYLATMVFSLRAYTQREF